MSEEEPTVRVAIGDRVGKEFGGGVSVAGAAAGDLVGPLVVDGAGVRSYRNGTLGGTHIQPWGQRRCNCRPGGGARSGIWVGRPSHDVLWVRVERGRGGGFGDSIGCDRDGCRS